ncbi:gluconokinase [Pseudomonas alabamensis]|jgi:gluconokinase|uniref:gluconokinase n=1 Tax=Pseudomonas alabamensis TaxID=3064349 RepID=UPI000745CD6B|nr:gluconokinase [Pseudomonas entomophila]AMA45612.1 gluconokinase [Pseudomonas monteilii]
MDSLTAIVVMGVSGCGKSSVGTAIAVRSGGHMIEGDAYHSPESIAKMEAGIALEDADRAGWLERLGEALQVSVRNGERPILACSALKRRYRDTLRQAMPGLGFVFLELSRAAARERVTLRLGHFMAPSLIDSQFATLEPPIGEPLTLVLDALQPAATLADQVDAWLTLKSAPQATYHSAR